MAGEEEQSVWPLPRFYFAVDIAGVADDLAFQEVSGLDTEPQVLKYRAGNSKVFSTVKMPGMLKSGNVTLKKGIFPGDNAFWDWYRQIQMKTIQRHKVTIRLLDQTGSATMVWTLDNAFPSRLTGINLKSEGSEVAVETLELVCEAISVHNPGGDA